jgi:hypothetical protein
MLSMTFFLFENVFTERIAHASSAHRGAGSCYLSYIFGHGSRFTLDIFAFYFQRRGKTSSLLSPEAARDNSFDNLILEAILFAKNAKLRSRRV